MRQSPFENSPPIEWLAFKEDAKVLAGQQNGNDAAEPDSAANQNTVPERIEHGRHQLVRGKSVVAGGQQKKSLRQRSVAGPLTPRRNNDDDGRARSFTEWLTIADRPDVYMNI